MCVWGGGGGGGDWAMDTKFNALTVNFLCVCLFVVQSLFTSISFLNEYILVCKSDLHHCVCVCGGGGGE